MRELTLLPLAPSQLDSSHERVIREIGASGGTREELELSIEHDFRKWLDSEVDTLPQSIIRILEDADWYKKLSAPRPANPGKLYEKIVKDLAEFSKVNRRSSALIVSYLPLMIELVKEFNYSSAGVAEVLNDSGSRVPIHWKGIEKVLEILRLPMRLQLSKVEELLQKDQIFVAENFRDADLETILEVVSDEVEFLHMGREFTDSFRSLIMPDNQKVIVPYLQTLFYLCVVAEYFNHPLEYLYTFKPRGRVCEFCLKVFPPQLASGGNPFLNNFKAVDKLSIDWARSRNDAPVQAEAFVEIVLSLSRLAFASRRRVAQCIRASLLRFIEITCPEEVTLPSLHSEKEVKGFLKRVCHSETGTRGIIEQRVCDFIGILNYGDSGWRPRGLGDPVNATNTSARKLGDADFQNSDQRRCVAIEAHAGRFTQVYAEEHLRTLHRNLRNRIGEWEGVSDLSNWNLEILFVVHETNLDSISSPTSLVSSKVRIITFGDWITETFRKENIKEDAMLAKFQSLVVDPIKRPNTPHPVKKRFREICCLYASEKIS